MLIPPATEYANHTKVPDMSFFSTDLYRSFAVGFGIGAVAIGIAVAVQMVSVA